MIAALEITSHLAKSRSFSMTLHGTSLLLKNWPVSELDGR